MNSAWDPFPSARQQLANAAVDGQPGGEVPLELAAICGGPWGRCVEWPKLFSPRLPARHRARSGVWARLLGRVAWPVQWTWTRATGWFAVAPSQAIPCGPTGPARQALIASLCDVHAWLENRNLAFLLRHLAPFHESIPYPLAAVGSRGVVGALMVRQAPPYAKSDLGDQFRLDASCLAGDMISRHLDVEQAALDLARQTASRPRAGYQARPVGGLRNQDFLSAWAGLTGLRGGAAGQARIGLEQLAHSSPLTRLIYADVLGGPGEPVALGPLCRLAAAGAPPASPDQKANSPGDWSWQEVWLAQLARSLVAALLGPSPGWEDLLEVERKIASRQEELSWAGQAGRLGKKHAERLRKELALLISQKSRLRAGLLENCVRKTLFLGRCFQSASADACCRALHYQTLEMLVRHVVQESLVPMGEAWRKTVAHDPYPMPRVALFDRGSASFRRFVRALFGFEPEDLPPRTWKAEEQEALRSLLAPGRIVDDQAESASSGSGMMPKEVAGQLGAPASWVRRLRARFEDESRGVRLPCPEPYEHGDPPSTILANWLGDLLNLIPEETTTIAEVQRNSDDET